MENDMQLLMSQKMKEKEKVAIMTTMVKSDDAALAQLFDTSQDGH